MMSLDSEIQGEDSAMVVFVLEWGNNNYYCKMGNFRGVLIFFIFVTDLAVTKFHP